MLPLRTTFVAEKTLGWARGKAEESYQSAVTPQQHLVERIGCCKLFFGCQCFYLYFDYYHQSQIFHNTHVAYLFNQLLWLPFKVPLCDTTLANVYDVYTHTYTHTQLHIIDDDNCYICVFIQLLICTCANCHLVW